MLRSCACLRFALVLLLALLLTDLPALAIAQQLQTAGIEGQDEGVCLAEDEDKPTKPRKHVLGTFVRRSGEPGTVYSHGYGYASCFLRRS